MTHGYQPVIDGDGHILERDQELYEYLPPPFNGVIELLNNPFFPTPDAFNRTAVWVMEGQGSPKRGDQRGKITVEVRTREYLEYLDYANVAVSVLFPSQGLGAGLIGVAEWAVALSRAYNDWLYDRWLRVNPKRLRGMALLPLQDPVQAAVELRRAVKDLGMVGGVLPSVGLWEAFGHRRYWPVYEAAQELDVPLAVHGGPIQQLGLDRLHTLIEGRVLGHPFSLQVQMTSMILGGVFDAFPRLRVTFCEAGMGWLPYLVERMDKEYADRPRQAPDLKVPPSEHFRNGRIFVQCELKERALALGIEYLGEHVFFCASDYPHEPKHELPEAMEVLVARTDIPESAKRKIVWDTPIRLYALDESAVRDAIPTGAGKGAM